MILVKELLYLNGHQIRTYVVIKTAQSDFFSLTWESKKLRK